MPHENQPRTSSSARVWLRLVLATVLVLGVAGFYALGLGDYFDWQSIRARLDELHQQAQECLLASVAAYFVTYVVITALSIPVASTISLLGGWLFGRWLGLVLVSAAATLGATLAFLSSRFLFRDILEPRFAARLQALDQGIERDGAYYLFTLRLVPIFPFFLVNLGMGLTRINVGTFVWVSWLGMLPGTFLYANAGEALKTIESPGDILSPEVLISFMLLGIAPLVFRKLMGLVRGGS